MHIVKEKPRTLVECNNIDCGNCIYDIDGIFSICEKRKEFIKLIN